MNIDILALIAVGGLVLAAVAGFLITALGKAKYDAGASDAKLEDVAKSDTAKRKADAVLAEHREPSDVDSKLRRGDF